jgi:hypothetical protein
MIDPGWQALFRERVAQAALGAQMNIENVPFIRYHGNSVTIGISLGAVFWDKETAVLIVMRNA